MDKILCWECSQPSGQHKMGCSIKSQVQALEWLMDSLHNVPQDVLRTFKYNKILELQKTSKIWSSWYKKNKGFYPSWGVSLFSVGNYLTFTQRQENQGRKKKRVQLFSCRVSK